jgi:hypothetical protein
MEMSDIVCFKHCSTMQSMLLVIMDISFIMMTFANFSFSMTLLGLSRIDKYPCTGMQNVVCTIGVMEHKRSNVVPVIVHNNMFMPNV